MTDHMNGPFIMGIAAEPLLNDTQQACVDLLREVAKEAEAGHVFGVGIVVCMDGGWASVMAGTRPGDLNLGCDDLKAKILDAVTSGNVARPKKRDTILRVK
jgi:hypothetical protein